MSASSNSNSPRSSSTELEGRERLAKLFHSAPMDDLLIDQLQLFLKRQDIMRLMFFIQLYERIVDVHGVIMEFGCRWGKNLALFTALRGIYEPYNHNRTVIGFDTFDGLTGIAAQDGTAPEAEEGAYGTTPDYEQYLKDVLNCLEAECPLPHIPKFELSKGDVRETLPDYLASNPQTVIAFAYFDMDIYEPTKAALEAIVPHITKGTIIGFDEMNWSTFPGPTLALKEVFGLDRFKINRSPLQPIPGWIEIV